MSVRTRFAPSPTGYLHIGGARTALFSWLHARKHGGTFILRIEDTDLERSTPESVRAILEGMEWLGLDYDEGPFYQTKRFVRYHAVIEQLLAQGDAYRCYCSQERIDALRESQKQNKQKPRYDGKCRELTQPPSDAGAEQPFVIRFRNPTQGQVQVDDAIRGSVTFQNSELDDLIIARSDGSPTYNLCVVVDDLDMGLTHVIRGDDHLNNTPRQINILKALNATPPVYAHVPMILGDDGKRLSKRHGAVGVMQFRDDGFLPEALLNYLVRLGWSHGDEEVFSIEQMKTLFDIGDINQAASTLNMDKLLWLNQHYIKHADPAHLARHLRWHLDQCGIDTSQGPDLLEVIKVQQDRAKTLVEMAHNSSYFYQDFDEIDPVAAKKNLRPVVLEPLQAIRAQLAELTEWTPQSTGQVVNAVVESMELKLGKVAQPLRVAITGQNASPSIDVTLWLIGQARVLRRIDHALEFIRARAQA